MKIHRQFIDELGKERKARVGEIIKTLKIVTLENNNIQDLNDNLSELEQIFYTVDYLIENNLVIQESYQIGSFVPDFNPMNFIKGKDGLRASRIHAMPRYLQQYWGREFLVRPVYFRMIENGYKTDEELKEDKQFWLAIGVAVLASFLTAIFTATFSNIF